MAINLSNVNVSIQQFQAVASGEVNAGEVKLTSETTLGKVNNFVLRKWKNKTDHTHEEVLAVKSAFIRALNSCGVVGDELARVRARLGLAPEPGDAVDHTLGKPDGPMLRRALELAADGNGTGGHFLGIREGMFMLSAVLPLEGLSADDLGRRILMLAAASKRVADELSRASAEGDGSAADSAQDSKGGDFMWV